MTPGCPGWARVVSALGGVAEADVVDLACGDGAVARWLVAAGARSVLALDLDPDALDRARDLAGRTDGDGRPDRILFEQADLEQATLPFEAYDLAWAPRVLATTPDPVRTARMVRAGLRPYARLVATVPAAAADRAVAALRGALLEEVLAVPVVTGEVVLTARKPPRRRP